MLKNALVTLILAVSAANVYFANQAVDNTAATHEAQCLANGVVGAVQHFQTLSEKTMELAIRERVRVMQLEQFIRDMGLPLPAEIEQPAPKKNRPEEVI